MPTAILSLTSAAMPAASIHTYDGEISSISVSWTIQLSQWVLAVRLCKQPQAHQLLAPCKPLVSDSHDQLLSRPRLLQTSSSSPLSPPHLLQQQQLQLQLALSMRAPPLYPKPKTQTTAARAAAFLLQQQKTMLVRRRRRRERERWRWRSREDWSANAKVEHARSSGAAAMARALHFQGRWPLHTRQIKGHVGSRILLLLPDFLLPERGRAESLFYCRGALSFLLLCWLSFFSWDLPIFFYCWDSFFSFFFGFLVPFRLDIKVLSTQFSFIVGTLLSFPSFRLSIKENI